MELNIIESLRKSILAGMMIGIGSTIYLVLENKIIGAILFSIGLFLICSFGMYLFTGKIGYTIKTKNKPNCLVIWFGNLIGSIIVSTMIRFAKPELHIVAAEFISNKLQQGFVSIVLLSILCGFLMFLAVDNYSKYSNSLSGILGIFLCVVTFILCGFEHSIADMNYCILAIESLSQAVNLLYFIFVVSIFNAVGAILMRWITTPIIKKEWR